MIRYCDELCAWQAAEEWKKKKMATTKTKQTKTNKHLVSPQRSFTPVVEENYTVPTNGEDFINVVVEEKKSYCEITVKIYSK